MPLRHKAPIDDFPIKPQIYRCGVKRMMRSQIARHFLRESRSNKVPARSWREVYRGAFPLGVYAFPIVKNCKEAPLKVPVAIIYI